MNKIISSVDGTYLADKFTGAKGEWKLIGSESTGDSEYSRIPKHWTMTSVGSTLDTFTNGKGNYITKKRSEIYAWAEAGDIF